MPGDQQQSQTGGSGTTPMQQPQTDWQARADAAARIPNPMYSSRAGTTPMQQPQTDWQARADAAASIPNPMYASRADRTYPGGESGRGALCSFIRSHHSCMIAGIAVLLSLLAVGLAPLTFINKEEISQLTTTFDAFKRDQDGMSTTVDALKRDLDKERNRTAALEQRLHEMSKTPGYTMWNETCYMVFNTRKTVSDAAATCHEDGGTLAMPRDAETDAFLISLVKQFVWSVLDRGYWGFWFGLHDRREEGSFEWVDGSALGAYNNWGRGQPDNRGGKEDCVFYETIENITGTDWTDYRCSAQLRFICQAAPGDKRNSRHHWQRLSDHMQ
uniref:C-type lectin domain-containing protein n=1 Tax=Branchiostoma floridae TaxID=7739 RepID=C3YSR0_BRAFL|eukprot:XP_002600749.1 hypothetical protein BRAFLDRAFT_83492 [Branchiostoma floridae]